MCGKICIIIMHIYVFLYLNSRKSYLLIIIKNEALYKFAKSSLYTALLVPHYLIPVSIRLLLAYLRLVCILQLGCPPCHTVYQITFLFVKIKLAISFCDVSYFFQCIMTYVSQKAFPLFLSFRWKDRICGRIEWSNLINPKKPTTLLLDIN